MIEITIIVFVSILISLAIILRIIVGPEKEGKSKARRGKRCPSCRTIIDYKRKVCQHCGYKFD